jgi:peptidyl-prolyl cis-trans isomerase D
VGSTSISSEKFSRDYRNYLRNMSQQAGRDITPDMAKKLGLGTKMVEQTVVRTAIDNLADEMGLTVSDADVSARIRTIPAFNGPLGTFDKDTFDRALAQRQMGEQEFIQSMRSDMEIQQMLQPVEDGFRIPPGYVHAIFAYSTELRATEYVVLTPQALGTVAPPSEAVLAAYVKAHPERFSTPEYRNVTVAVAGPEDVAASVKVTDAALQQAYIAAKETFVIPEKRDVDQITFADEASAKAAKAKIDSGTSFADVAKATGKSIDSRGSVSQDDLAANGAPVFALPMDGVSAPLKNFSSWVLMHVTKITLGKTTTLEQAKPELTKALTNQMAQNKLIDIANAYTDAVSSGAEIDQAAKKSGMRLVHITAMDAHGLGPDGKPVALPADPELDAQIFTADPGESGDPFQTKTGHTYVIAVQGTTPPKMKSLDTVRAEAERMWIAEQTGILLKKRAEQLTAEARKAGNLMSVAQTLGTPILFGPGINRDKTDGIFSAALVQEIFLAPHGGIVSGPMGNAPGNYVIARVTGVVHPPLPEASPGFVQGMRQVNGEVAQDITMSMAKAARDKQGVKINQSVVDRVVGGDNGS